MKREYGLPLSVRLSSIALGMWIGTAVNSLIFSSWTSSAVVAAIVTIIAAAVCIAESLKGKP